MNIIKESEAEIPESVLNRAHLIGQTILTVIREKRYKAQLSDFRHRTLFYANRRNIKSGAVIRLNLTKDRYNLLVSGRKRVNNCHEVNYVYADINCRLKVMD